MIRNILLRFMAFSPSFKFPHDAKKAQKTKKAHFPPSGEKSGLTILFVWPLAGQKSS